MEISNTTSTTLTETTAGENPNGILDKDDFLMLLLTELKYQDPTDPMDTSEILSQTSQLASLEAAENTNKALEELALSLGNSMQFSTISAIGKTADTGSNAIVLDEGSSAASFELYFPDDVQSGTINIMDANGNVISTMNVDANDKGVYLFDWNGMTSEGEAADAGIYYVEAAYVNPAGESQMTRVGTYPIESIRFDEGQTLVKLGSSYVPFESIQEIY